MTKIAITADLHFCAANLADIKKGWNEMIDHLITNNIYDLLIAGDLFETYNIAGREASFGTIYDTLAEPLRRYLKKDGQVFTIPGNHDIAGPNQKDALVSLEEYMKIVREPKGIYLNNTTGKIYVYFLPWLYNATKSPDELIPHAPKDCVSILIGHCELAGLKVNEHYTIKGGHFELPKQAFFNKGYHYIGLGHIHKKMDFYVGAPWQLSHRDEGNPAGFTVLEIGINKIINEQWIEIKTPLKYYSYNYEDIKDIKPDEKDHIKIRYTDTLPQIELPPNVTLEKVSTKEALRVRTNISIGSSLPDMLKIWAAENNITEPSTDELLSTITKESLHQQQTSRAVGSIQEIEKITLNHIGPHTCTELLIGGRKFISISGRNGSGKTFAVEAIFAVLFGNFPSRNGSIYDHITQGYEGEASLEVIFKSFGTRFSAKRIINNKGSHKAFLTQIDNNTIIAGPKVSNFEKEIAGLIGSESIVLSSIFSSQKGTGDIVDASPADRKEILGHILGIDYLADISENAKQKTATLKAEIDADGRRIKELTDREPHKQLAATRSHIKSSDEKLKHLSLELDSQSQRLNQIKEDGQEVGALMAKAEEAGNSLKEVSLEIKTLEGDIVSLQQQIAFKNELLANESVIRTKYKEICDAKEQYAAIQIKHEENLKSKTKQTEIDSTIAREHVRTDQEKRNIEKEILTQNKSLNIESEAHSRYVKNLNSLLQIHVDNQKRTNDAGCKSAPLPCPFINDALDSESKIENMKKQIKDAQATHQENCILIRHKIEELSSALIQNKYATEERARIALLQQERQKIPIHPISNEEVLELKRIIDSEKDVLSQLHAIQTGKESIEDLQNRINSVHEKLSNKKTRREELNATLANNANVAKRYAELKTKWADTVKLKEEAQAAILKITTTTAILVEQAKRHEEEMVILEILAQKQAQDIRQLKIFETLVRAFGKNGIAQLLIDTALPQLQDILETLLEKLNHKYTIKLSTQEETKGNKAKETLGIIVGDWMGERDIRDFSGGEQKLLKSVIRIALAVFQAQRSGSRYEILIIDEAFDALDRENAMKVLEILASLQDRFNQIIVISHTDELLCEFPVRINFKRTYQGSEYSFVAA